MDGTDSKSAFQNAYWMLGDYYSRMGAADRYTGFHDVDPALITCLLALAEKSTPGALARCQIDETLRRKELLQTIGIMSEKSPALAYCIDVLPFAQPASMPDSILVSAIDALLGCPRHEQVSIDHLREFADYISRKVRDRYLPLRWVRFTSFLQTTTLRA